MAKRSDGDMSWSFEANEISWEDVTKKALNRCDKYIKNQPNKYPNNSICVLYYKGTTPTNDSEKISVANSYYGNKKSEIFFNSNNKSFKTNSNNLSSTNDIVSQLKNLKELLDSGAITQDEFEKLKKKILN